MINTHSGEMVEPRVGDVVGMGGREYVLGDFNASAKEAYACVNKKMHIGMLSALPVPTLLHRPFQEGDDIEVIAERHIRRHTNPALRDHPEYKGAK